MITNRTEVIDTSTRQTTHESCRGYIGGRRSCYEFRSIRYQAVYETMLSLGFKLYHSVADIGGADGEFGRYLREQGHTGYYTVIDGYVDGTDLNLWEPPNGYAAFVVSIEVIEHLYDPQRFLRVLEKAATTGVVLTTPNPLVVDVLAMDATHISPVLPDELVRAGFTVQPRILFREEGDSLLAWKKINLC